MSAMVLSAQEKRVVELVRRYQAGDKSAYDGIYSLTYNGIYYMVYKMLRDEYEAQDVVQEIYVTIYKNLAELDDPQSFKKWANRIAWHAAVSHIREMGIRNGERRDGAELTEDISDEKDPIAELEQHSAVMQAVDTLEPGIRAVVLMKYFQNLKEKEIAEIVGIPVGTVKSRLSNAKKQLSEKLTGVYALAPFFFLRYAASRNVSFREAAAAGTEKGTAALAAVGHHKKAAALVGIAAGTAAAVALQGPEIKDMRIYSLDHFINEQCLVFEVSSPLPVKSITLEGCGSEIVKDEEQYSAAILENGSYLLTVTDAAGQSDREEIHITNIDSEAPHYTASREEESGIVISFADDLSGIDWKQLSFTDSEGQTYEPAAINPENGEVLIDKNDFPVYVQTEDMAGNFAVYEISLECFEIGEEAAGEDAEL